MACPTTDEEGECGAPLLLSLTSHVHCRACNRDWDPVTLLHIAGREADIWLDSEAISLHLGSPVYQPQRVRRLLADLAAVFRVVRPMGVFVPLYGAYWGLACASDSLDPCALDAAEVARRLTQRRIGELRLYNPEMHGALFALPNFYRELLPAG